MPNIRGGKAYKKSKGSNSDTLDPVFLDKESDQMVGRIVRILGNLNTYIFCEDNKQRICKIRPGIKRRVRFEVGDVVLISLRDCEISVSELEKGVRSDRGDIIAKYHPQQYNQLKLDGVNPHIFVNIDTIVEITTKLANGDIRGAEAAAAEDNDNFFDMTGEKEEEEEKEKSDTEEGLQRPTKAWKDVRSEVLRNKALSRVANGDNEVNINDL